VRRYALESLPGVSSLRSLRVFAAQAHGSEPFAGFGDPDFSGAGSTRGIRLAEIFRGASVDVDAVRKLPRLPETADELRALARILHAPDSSLHLGRHASVTEVERTDLSGARIIAFSTHGLVAGDLPGLAEPALALTPPAAPGPGDDGLLTASRVAGLKLNADWVVLSACNTAAPDGSPGAEGLSGLAKAFFYAGARSLLVSHWPVNSNATVELITGAFRALETVPGLSRAEALRRSMLAMIEKAGVHADAAHYAHPMIWAPFVVVGD
jgi:CHAT domain-containing protein